MSKPAEEIGFVKSTLWPPYCIALWASDGRLIVVVSKIGPWRLIQEESPESDQGDQEVCYVIDGMFYACGNSRLRSHSVSTVSFFYRCFDVEFNQPTFIAKESANHGILVIGNQRRPPGPTAE